jgi:hypothetical protein
MFEEMIKLSIIFIKRKFINFHFNSSSFKILRKYKIILRNEFGKKSNKLSDNSRNLKQVKLNNYVF